MCPDVPNHLLERALENLHALDLRRVVAASGLWRSLAEGAAAAQVRTRRADLFRASLLFGPWLPAAAQVAAPPLLLAAGGYDSRWNNHAPGSEAGDELGCTRTAEVVCALGQGAWRTDLPDMRSRRADCALVAGHEAGVAYVVGGRSAEVASASVERLDLVGWHVNGHCWNKMPDMAIERKGAAACLLRGELVVAGGANNSCGHNEYLRSAEVLKEDLWTDLPPMVYGRALAASAVLEDRVYVVGGVDGAANEKVEVFDLGREEWALGPQLWYPRWGAGCVAAQGRVLVAGGLHWSDGRNDSIAIEALDPREGCWTTLALHSFCARGSMSCRWGCALAAHSADVYIVGGTLGRCISEASVLALDLRTLTLGQAISTTNVALRVPRWCGGACIV